MSRWLALLEPGDRVMFEGIAYFFLNKGDYRMLTKDNEMKVELVAYIMEVEPSTPKRANLVHVVPLRMIYPLQSNEYVMRSEWRLSMINDDE